MIALLAIASIPSSGRGAEGECPPAAPKAKRTQWPSPPEKGAFDIVHFGEGHWNEGQGPKTMPVLVQDVVRFRPRFVAFSSDIADIGTPDRLGCFRLIMQPLLSAGIPWFDSPGNHDRVAVAGPGGVASGSIDIWREVFAGMPAPWGDEPAPGPRFQLPENEPDDGKGASTHYYFDYGKGRAAVRLIVLDNSQQGLTNSDVDQYPAVGPGATDANQLAFLERAATEAQEKGSLAFVTMHQPTQDPRDPTTVHPISVNHTMGKGLSPDNLAFDAIASRSGVDAVLLGHIQGNALYSVGDTRYFIDGGGGGSPYTTGPTGTDTGYYYGYRLLRIFRSKGEWTYRTYFIPLVDRIRVTAPKTAAVGDELELAATAVQPFDPDLPPRLGGAPNEAIEVELRPPADGPFRAALPELAYVWETSDASVLRPLGAEDDPKSDPIFDPKTMTMSGRFEAVRPGVAIITVRVGTHTKSLRVQVGR